MNSTAPENDQASGFQAIGFRAADILSLYVRVVCRQLEHPIAG
jgi:hypothetical protein